MWPENYSVNSAQKVWAASFAARHPNVVVLDLSSFKCGHDAPTYGLIDSIIETSKTPYAALHDIDANKPGGSDQDPRQDVRPRAQAPRGAPAGRAQAQAASSQHAIDRKRLELLALRRQQLAARSQRDPAIEAQLAELRARVQAYEVAARRPSPRCPRDSCNSARRPRTESSAVERC